MVLEESIIIRNDMIQHLPALKKALDVKQEELLPGIGKEELS